MNDLTWRRFLAYALALSLLAFGVGCLIAAGQDRADAGTRHHDRHGSDWDLAGTQASPRPTVYVFAEGRCQRIDVKVFWDGVPSRARSGVRVITDGRVDFTSWQPAGRRFGAVSVHRDWRGVTDKGTRHRVVVKVNRGDGWHTRRVVETGGCHG